MKQTLTDEKNIVLIGFMGVGKTTVGQILAQKLQRDFVDIDDKIEQLFQMTIPEIFSKYGEKIFREKERELVLNYCRHYKRKVISLGGGAFLQDAVKQTCLETCTVVFLEMSWDSWKDRYNLIIGNRPLLKNRSMEDIKQLFEERKHVYAHHHVNVKLDGINPSDASTTIIQKLTMINNTC